MNFFILFSCAVFTCLPVLMIGGRHNFINLSRFDYYVHENFGKSKIRVISKNEGYEITCFNCTYGSFEKACEHGSLTSLEVVITFENVVVSFLFNVSCETKPNSRNLDSILSTKEVIGTDNISVSWNHPADHINYFYIIFMKTNNLNSTLITEKAEVTFSSLKEKSHYQFCIATIDKRWRTSLFYCKVILIDFVEGKRKENYWSAWEIWRANPLSHESNFEVQMVPFNRNKRSTIENFNNQVKENSGTVQNLNIFQLGDELLKISFDEPKKPKGVIMKYKVRITKTSICVKLNEDLHITYINSDERYLPICMLKKCASYLFEVSPVNELNNKGGFVEMVSAPFEYYNSDPMESTVFHAKFIAANMISISVRNLINENKCSMKGFVIEVTGEDNKNNCLTIISFADNCTELSGILQEKYKCPNIEFIKFDRLTENFQYFSTMFRYAERAKFEASTINNKLGTSIYSKVLFSEQIQDCFTDCYYPGEEYKGIKSVTKDGYTCTYWNETKYLHYKNVKSNICSSIKNNYPWCMSKNGWKECDVPPCSDINYGTGCVEVLNKIETAESVTIIWSSTEQNANYIGYITLLYNQNHSCVQYHVQLCKDCGSDIILDRVLGSFYLSCFTGKADSSITFKTIFKSLYPKRRYTVYIIPIIDQFRTGEVKKLIIQTKLGKPSQPKNILMKPVSLGQMYIKWEKSEEITSETVTYYSVGIRMSISIGIHFINVFNVSKTLTDLRHCCEYCIQIASKTEVDSSDFSPEVCEYTFAPKPSIVELKQPVSGYMLNTVLNWKYLGTEKCSKIYRIYAKIKFLEENIELTSVKETILLKNLKKNVIYTVKVRAESQMKTLENENIGEYSEIREFYTGNVSPNVSFYNTTISVTNENVILNWGIEDRMKGAIFEFIILIKSSDSWSHSVHLKCRNCTNVEQNKYLTKSDQMLRKTLLNRCRTIQIEQFDPDQIFFHSKIQTTEVLRTVEIYSVSFIGIKLLYKTPIKAELSKEKQITIIISIIIILLFVVVFLVLGKRNPDLFRRLVNRNIDENRDSFVMEMQEI